MPRLNAYDLAMQNAVMGEPQRPPRPASVQAHHDFDMEEPQRPPRPASVQAHHDFDMEEPRQPQHSGGNRSRCNDAMSAPAWPPKFPPGNVAGHTKATNETQPHPVNYQRCPLICEGPSRYVRPPLTQHNLGSHNFASDEPESVRRSDSVVAQHAGETNNSGRPITLNEVFDYTDIGWHTAEHQEGGWGRWEPRARRRY